MTKPMPTLNAILLTGLLAAGLSGTTDGAHPTFAQTLSQTRATTGEKPHGSSTHSATRLAPSQAALSASRAAIAADEGPVVAHVGETDLHEENIRGFLANLSESDRAALKRNPNLLSQFVRALLANQLALREALAKHWDQRPEVVEQLQRARELTIVESYLKSVNQPPANFPDAATVQSVYDTNKSAFVVPRQYHLAQIFIPVPADGEKAAMEKAAKKVADAEARLKKGEDFATVVHADSEARDAEQGGDTGWLPETQLKPELKNAVIGLSKGGVSDAVKLDDGWHILELIDTKASYTRPLSEVQDALAQKLRDERAAANRRAYLADLLKQNPPAINEIALTKILADSGTRATP